MENKVQGKKENKKKGFLRKMIEKLDRKMEEKAKRAPCCGSNGSSKNSKGNSCCK